MLKKAMIVNTTSPILLLMLIISYWSITGVSITAITKEDISTRFLTASVLAKEAIIEAEEKIPYITQRTLDYEAKRGSLQELQRGENGIIKRKYLVCYENGNETGRRIIEETVLQHMQPEIISVGVKDIAMIASRSLPEPKTVLELESTAYTHTGNPTFTGVYPQIGTIAVDPKIIPLGTRMWVEGYGYGTAQDTGGLIKGNIIDLFMDTEKECWKWGRRKVKVYILN